MLALRAAQALTDLQVVNNGPIAPWKKDTTSRGDISEFEVALALMRAGRRVLRPVSAGLRYDLVIDEGGGRFTRVQCKTGRLLDGVISFRLCISDGRRPTGVPYHGEIEAFGVHCPQTRRSYLVPMTDLGHRRSTAHLRLTPARNGQCKGIRDAASYEIG